mmetsp:Transcript_9287/g.22661  ORF Transcript_9287/g.22661 Transcript_9287/m.22661 type:complete len:757 (-) Transcript_9287:1046-3316(-)|eukprot:CAMPEP_0181136562 /NCGR_PEP_ID=MMETSP1071-20121207/33242_1 /TAXON_ID=35127 /ORGANISM="Thalassiosira sp., Strain NH16" /LENGTH=756 /DNA_ID=CAMNT_0023223265 /DNA_START=392 /DNA_END=2662 /DNA_ORIENTATION=+
MKLSISIAVLTTAASTQAFNSISTPAATLLVSTNKIAGDAFAPVPIRSSSIQLDAATLTPHPSSVADAENPSPLNFFQHEEVETWSQEQNIQELLANFGSNVWVISEGQLEANFRAWLQVAGSADKIWYPVKANPSPVVLEVLQRLGAGVECASPAEIGLARKSLFSNDRIIYHSPSATEEVALSVLRSGGTVIVDSKEFLVDLDSRLGLNKSLCTGRVLLRVNPSINIGHENSTEQTELMAHANSQGKFGIPSEDIVDITRELSNIDIVGLHLHVGTQMDNTNAFGQAANHLKEIANKISKETKHSPRILDLGGGLGIPFSYNDKQYPSIESFGKSLTPVIDKAFEYWFEPGQTLVGNAIGLLGSITSIKSMRGRFWAIADVGFDQNIKISLMNWVHPVLGPKGIPLPAGGPDAIGGPLCFAGDVVLPETDVSSLVKGDAIFVQHCGAYSGSCANTFNGRRSGGTVVVRKDRTVVRACPPASLSAEPLAKGYSWGLMLDQKHEENECFNEQEKRPFETESLSSELLLKATETFSYDQAFRDSQNAYQYIIKGKSDYNFASLPFLLRMASDAAIVSILHRLGLSEKAFSVMATEAYAQIQGRVDPQNPIKLMINLSSFDSESKTLAIRFEFNDGVADGELQAVYDTPNDRTSTVTDAASSSHPVADSTDGAKASTKKSPEEIIVLKTIAEQAVIPVENICTSFNLANDLNLDSIDRYTIINDIEEEFDVCFGDETILKIATVQDLSDELLALTAKN